MRLDKEGATAKKHEDNNQDKSGKRDDKEATAEKNEDQEEQLLCRICLEEDSCENLISPCKCTGSQKYVHLQCIRKWQTTQQSRAVRCNICNAKYSCQLPEKPWVEKALKEWSSTVATIAVLYVVLHLWMFTIVTCVLVYLRANSLVPVFIGGRLRLIRRGEPVDDLRRMMFLVAQDHMSSSSIFFQSVILLTEHDSAAGSLGIIVNKRRPYAKRLINTDTATCGEKSERKDKENKDDDKGDDELEDADEEPQNRQQSEKRSDRADETQEGGVPEGPRPLGAESWVWLWQTAGLGGPCVRQGRSTALHNQPGVPGSQQVLRGLYRAVLRSDPEGVGEDMLNLLRHLKEPGASANVNSGGTGGGTGGGGGGGQPAPSPRSLLMLHGFSSWGPLQLDGEVRAGSWAFCEATPELAELIFDPELSQGQIWALLNARAQTA